jgi:hypothetical protein
LEFADADLVLVGGEYGQLVEVGVTGGLFELVVNVLAWFELFEVLAARYFLG